MQRIQVIFVTILLLFIATLFYQFIFLRQAEQIPEIAEKPEALKITNLRFESGELPAITFSVDGFKGSRTVHTFLATSSDATPFASTSLRVVSGSNEFNFAPVPEGSYFVRAVTDDGQLFDAKTICTTPGSEVCKE